MKDLLKIMRQTQLKYHRILQQLRFPRTTIGAHERDQILRRLAEELGVPLRELYTDIVFSPKVA